MHRKVGFLLLALAASCLIFSTTATAGVGGDDYHFFSDNLGLPRPLEIIPPQFLPPPFPPIQVFDGTGEGVLIPPVPGLFEFRNLIDGAATCDLGGAAPPIFPCFTDPWLPGLVPFVDLGPPLPPVPIGPFEVQLTPSISVPVPPMTVDELVVPGTLLGLPPSVEMLEFELESSLGPAGGFFLNTDRQDPLTFGYLDIDDASGAADYGLQLYDPVPTTWLYFTVDGVPQNQMFDSLGIGIPVDDHPILGPGVQVAFFGDAGFIPKPGLGLAKNGADLLFTTDPAFGFPLPLSYPFLLAVLGVDDVEVNIDGIHMGIVADSSLPVNLDIKPGDPMEPEPGGPGDVNPINLKRGEGKLNVAILSNPALGALGFPVSPGADGFFGEDEEGDIDDLAIFDTSSLLLADRNAHSSIFLLEALGVGPDNVIIDEDANGDSIPDLKLQYDIAELIAAGVLSEGTTEMGLTGLSLGAFGSFRIVAYDDVKIVPTGDANMDQVVDAADYTIWANNSGMASASLGDGDFNEDGSVDAADYTEWANNFGEDLSGTPASVFDPIAQPEMDFSGAFDAPDISFDWTAASGIASVPEPSTFVLACFALLGLTVYGWRRRR